MHGYAVPSNHHGCHLAMLIRDPLELVEERHDRATPWWHALCHLLVTVHGRLLHVAGVHFAPASPTQRLIEAEACSLIPQKGSAILLGDMNAVSLIDPPHPLGAEAPLRIRRKYDRRPAEELEGAGLRDVGAILGDSDPTVGHDSGLVYRCDRIHTTLPRTAMVSHRVIREEHPTSDHRPVVAEFDV
jgi:endonuclease/exonuclease/phosphatase family metal-dependent hydrolase